MINHNPYKMFERQIERGPFQTVKREVSTTLPGNTKVAKQS